MKWVLTLLAFLACTVPSRPVAPAVHVVAPEGLLPEYLDGASGWAPLGFDVSGESSGLVECQRRWYASQSDTRDCQLTIGVVVEPGLIERTGSDAAASREFRTVFLDDSLAGERLLQAVAHEAGHILLDTPRHTQGGIMGGVSYTMWDVDRELACETLGICI